MRYPKLSTRETSVRTRSAVLLVEVPIFLIAIPVGLVMGGRALDRLLGLSPLAPGWINFFLGVLLGVPGIVFAFWSISEQFVRGRGTPAPQMPSQELVETGPYTLTRNPMALGAILMYLGIAAMVGSLATALIVVILGALLLAFIKTGEEPALEERFGDPYRDYRHRTPFLIPRLRK